MATLQIEADEPAFRLCPPQVLVNHKPLPVSYRLGFVGNCDERSPRWCLDRPERKSKRSGNGFPPGFVPKRFKWAVFGRQTDECV